MASILNFFSSSLFASSPRLKCSIAAYSNDPSIEDPEDKIIKMEASSKSDENKNKSVWKALVTFDLGNGYELTIHAQRLLKANPLIEGEDLISTSQLLTKLKTQDGKDPVKTVIAFTKPDSQSVRTLKEFESRKKHLNRFLRVRGNLIDVNYLTIQVNHPNKKDDFKWLVKNGHLDPHGFFNIDTYCTFNRPEEDLP